MVFLTVAQSFGVVIHISITPRLPSYVATAVLCVTLNAQLFQLFGEVLLISLGRVVDVV